MHTALHTVQHVLQAVTLLGLPQAGLLGMRTYEESLARMAAALRCDAQLTCGALA